MRGPNRSFDAEFDDSEDFQRRLVAGSFQKVFDEYEPSHEATKGPLKRLSWPLRRRRGF